MLVPESWFFRDGAPFAFLETWAREEWLPAAAGGASARAQRPVRRRPGSYSIAMTLLDAGLRPGQCMCARGDLSARRLEKARAAEYPDRPFRGRDAAGRDHHFEAAGRGMRRVRENIRGTVRLVSLQS